MQSSSTFIRIPGPIPEVKKLSIDQSLGKDFCILGRIRAKRGIGKKVRFVPNTVVWRSGRGRNPNNIL